MAWMTNSKKACYCAHNNDKAGDSWFKYWDIKLHFYTLQGTDRVSMLKIWQFVIVQLQYIVVSLSTSTPHERTVGKTAQIWCAVSYGAL